MHYSICRNHCFLRFHVCILSYCLCDHLEVCLFFSMSHLVTTNNFESRMSGLDTIMLMITLLFMIPEWDQILLWRLMITTGMTIKPFVFYLMDQNRQRAPTKMTSKVQCQFLILQWMPKMFTRVILRKLAQIFKASDQFFLADLSSFLISVLEFDLL